MTVATSLDRCGKRLLDMFGAGAGLLCLSPLLLVLMIWIRFQLGRPVFFRQQRPGLHGRPFSLVKFRSMTDATGPDGQRLSDAERLTPFGRWLRASSLDELPELWNVLRGEMSLVGPRPLMTAYLDRYTSRQARRHEVRPGITGWAQIHGRNALDWESRLEMDVWYVDHRSLGLDLKILGRTFGQVFTRQGISAEGHATMPPFQGRCSDDITEPEQR